MPELLDRPSEYKQNSPERKLCISIRRIALRKAGYEGESLADVARARRIARRGLQHARDAETFAIYSRELERWIERERILLRIPLPAASKSSEPRSIPGRTSASLVVREPIEATPAQAPAQGPPPETGPR